MSRPPWKTLLLEWAIIVVVGSSFARALVNFDPSSLQQTGEHSESATLPLLAEIGLHRYGEVPLWNPYMLTGLPHVGDPLGHFWHPVSTLPIMIWGGINGMKLSVFFAFIIAGLGQWLFAYTMGVSRMFRLWSATLFMVSGGVAMLWRIGWYELLLGVAWFPWCFALYWHSLRTRTLGSVFLVSGAIFMVISAGGGYYPIYLCGSLGVLFLVALCMEPSARRLGIVRVSVLTVAASAALCAIVLVPYVDSLSQLSRDVAEDKLQHFSQPVQYGLINYVVHTTDWYNTTTLGTAPGCTWFYIGWLPLAALMFVPLGLIHARHRVPMLVSGILFVFLMLWFANPFSPVKLIYDMLPWLYQLRFPNRLLIIAASPLLILAALGLEVAYRYSQAAIRGRAVLAQPKIRWWAHYFIALIWAVVLFATTAIVYDVNQKFAFADQRLASTPFDALRWLKQHDPALYYVNIGGGVIYWKWTPAAYSLEMPVINFLYSRHLKSQDAQRAKDSPFVARAKYQISLPDQPPQGGQRLRDFGDITVWSVPDTLPYAFSAQPTSMARGSKLSVEQVAPVDVKIDGPNRVVVHGAPTHAGDALVVLMSSFPGWKLLIDGQPAEVTPYNGYLGARMLPGARAYTFYFRPAQYVIGAAISLVTLLAMVVTSISAYLRPATGR